MSRPAFVSIVLCLLAAASALSHAGSLLQDPGFASGYEVMSPTRDAFTDSSKPEAVHREAGSVPDKMPVWRLVQWGSGKSIANVPGVVVPDGGTTWTLRVPAENGAVFKQVITGLQYPLPGEPLTRFLVLEDNGLAEFSDPDYRHLYGGKGLYLAGREQYWPHLMMLQGLRTEKLAVYKSLNLSFDAQLLFDHTNIRDGYQKELHAARFVISLLVRNTLSGNSFWLNIPVYDDRYLQTPFGCQKCIDGQCRIPASLDEPGNWVCPFDGDRWSMTGDKKGTRRMIFRIPTQAITRDDIHSGKLAHFAVDLMPYIRAGVEAAGQQGKLQGFSPSLMFYNLGLFSMGWEITGLNHAAMEVKNLTLDAQ